MFKTGFCKFHGSEHTKVTEAPRDLTICSEVILSNLLFRILQHLRSLNDNVENEIEDIEPYLEMINELTTLGSPLRKILVKFLLSVDFFSEKIKNENAPSTFTDNENIFLQTFTSDQRIPSQFSDVIPRPEYKNILNEILFWCVVYEFPKSLVKFLLNLFADHEYKAEFTKVFLTQYLNISVQSLRNSEIINISLITVQLFSNQLITTKALEQYCLLPILLSTIYNVLTEPDTLIPCALCKNSRTPHLVANLNSLVIQKCLYWSASTDLVQALAHKTVAISLLNDSNLFNLLLNLLGYFQASNVNERRIDTHVEYELTSYYNSFQTELEFCSSTVWSLMAHLKNKGEKTVLLNCIKMIEISLFKWLDIVDVPNMDQLTFQLPLQRFYSILLHTSVFRQDVNIDELLVFDETNLIKLLSYPLQAQIGSFEINANIWILNGEEMQEQVMMYIQYYLNDPDLFLLQLILCKFKNHDLLMKILFERFHVNDCFKKTGDIKKQQEMLKYFFIFLAQLICIEPNLQADSRSLARMEIMNVLCVGNRSYSEIKECIPEYSKLKKSKNEIEETINEIADFKQPSFELNSKDLKQGYYVLKDSVWLNQYDPLHLMFRTVGSYGRFQKSFERYIDLIKVKNLGNSNIWPPFRVPKYEKNTISFDLLFFKLNILQTRALHTLVFKLIYQHFYEQEWPEEIFSIIIYILELNLYRVRKNRIFSPHTHLTTFIFYCQQN